MVHVDVKKLGRLPPGGGWRMLGRDKAAHQSKHRVGYDFVHWAVPAAWRTREILSDQRGPTCASFWERARQFFDDHGVTIGAVLTDNARNYLGRDFTHALGAIEHPDPPSSASDHRQRL